MIRINESNIKSLKPGDIIHNDLDNDLEKTLYVILYRKTDIHYDRYFILSLKSYNVFFAYKEWLIDHYSLIQ